VRPTTAPAAKEPTQVEPPPVAIFAKSIVGEIADKIPEPVLN
jgi:hypothetical protein